MSLTRSTIFGLALLWSTITVAAEPPNFIFINVDDLGYADIRPFGSKLNRTPNLDRMAAEGRKLTCFYAAPVCSPSRSSLMTACYPKRVGLPNVLFPGDAIGINASEHTLPELLKAQGYATACIGKWHLGDQPEFLPTRHGFDYYFGLPYSNDMGPIADGARSSLGERPDQKKAKPKNAARADHPPLPLMRNEQVIERVRGEEQTTLVERYTEEAIKFVKANAGKRFFLYLPHTAVHFPLYPGKAFQKKSPNGIYSDWVEEVDWSVGRLLDAVRELNLGAKTLVIFTSDNGGTPRAVNTPLRGNKASTWEGGMREPTIAWWPGTVPAGTTTDAVTSMMDILPTLVTLAGGSVPTDRKLDGGDIGPLLLARPDAKSPHESLFYYFRGNTLEAVRSGPWKLHLARSELYNLESDIGESQNAAAQQPEIVAQLRKLADATKDDLGMNAAGPGCREPGRVANAQPLISQDGRVREGFGHANQ